MVQTNAETCKPYQMENREVLWNKEAEKKRRYRSLMNGIKSSHVIANTPSEVADEA